MAVPFEPDDNITQVTPDQTPAPLPADELADLTDETGLLDAEALTIEQDQRTAYGRSWAFDFIQGTFAAGPTGGPLETRSLATLRGWVEKCLRTEGGGVYPIYSTDYGVVGVDSMIGLGQDEEALHDYGDKLWEALTFHPRITDVVGYKAFVDPDDETVTIAFQVVTDTGDQIAFTDFRIF